MERHPTTNTIREMKIKTRYNYIPVKMGKMLVKIWDNRNSHSLLVGMQNGTATLESSLDVYMCVYIYNYIL